MQAVTVGLERLRALTEVTTLAGDHMGFFFSLHQFSDFALLALRIALGAVFLTHGLGKRKLWSTQPSAQMPAGMLRNLRILSIAEPAGALGMLVGFLTQLAALGLVIAMLGALQFLITKVHRKFTFAVVFAGRRGT